jgi:hypothetical protein
MASLANLPVLPELPPPDTTTNEVVLSGVDDWHHHLRDGDVLPLTVGCAASQVCLFYYREIEILRHRGVAHSSSCQSYYFCL